jgi:hypothetical protein
MASKEVIDANFVKNISLLNQTYHYINVQQNFVLKNKVKKIQLINANFVKRFFLINNVF